EVDDVAGRWRAKCATHMVVDWLTAAQPLGEPQKAGWVEVVGAQHGPGRGRQVFQLAWKVTHGNARTIGRVFGGRQPRFAVYGTNLSGRGDDRSAEVRARARAARPLLYVRRMGLLADSTHGPDLPNSTDTSGLVVIERLGGALS